MLHKVKTFTQFEEWAKSFGGGGFNLLVVIGDPGLSKTRTMRAVCPDARVIQGGALSALQFYSLMYEYRNQPIIVDDVDGLYQDKSAIRLLKLACQTEAVKEIAWQTKSKLVPHDEEGNPIREFTTTSKFAIIANDWQTLNKNVAAVMDRGHTIFFEPDTEDLHKRVGQWFKDDEVYEFIGENLDNIANPSMRTYLQAKELKEAKFKDWREKFLLLWQGTIHPERALSRLKTMKMPDKDKERLWEQWTGYKRDSYYRMKRNSRAFLTEIDADFPEKCAAK